MSDDRGKSKLSDEMMDQVTGGANMINGWELPFMGDETPKGTLVEEGYCQIDPRDN